MEILLYCPFKECEQNVAEWCNFEGGTELVKLGVDAFIWSVNWGHSEESWIGLVKLQISLLIHRMWTECLCEHGVGIWRRVSFEWICASSQLTEITAVTLRTDSVLTACSWFCSSNLWEAFLKANPVVPERIVFSLVATFGIGFFYVVF